MAHLKKINWVMICKFRDKLARTHYTGTYVHYTLHSIKYNNTC